MHPLADATKSASSVITENTYTVLVGFHDAKVSKIGDNFANEHIKCITMTEKNPVRKDGLLN